MTIKALYLTTRELSCAQLKELSAVLDATWPVEIDCETLLERLAEYVERARGHTSVPEDLILIRRHMEVCPECREVAEALLRALDQDLTATA